MTDPSWEVPWVAGPGPSLPVPTLWAVVRVVDRRSRTDPTGPSPSPAQWGMPGSRLPHTPSYLILSPPPLPPPPLVHKLLPGSLGERQERSQERTLQRVEDSPAPQATPPALHTQMGRHLQGSALGGRETQISGFQASGKHSTSGGGVMLVHLSPQKWVLEGRGLGGMPLESWGGLPATLVPGAPQDASGSGPSGWAA